MRAVRRLRRLAWRVLLLLMMMMPPPREQKRTVVNAHGVIGVRLLSRRLERVP